MTAVFTFTATSEQAEAAIQPIRQMSGISVVSLANNGEQFTLTVSKGDIWPDSRFDNVANLLRDGGLDATRAS